MNCGKNEIFAIRKECPRTCLDPEGRNFCGIRVPRESCYCRDGFVRNSAGQCVPYDQCGCKVPNRNLIIGPGRFLIDPDCSKKYFCRGPQQNVQIIHLRRCSPNAVCKGNRNNVPTCFCKSGFVGNGFNCRAIVLPTAMPSNPCRLPGVCGRGSICINRNGKAQCQCRGQNVDNKTSCCNRELRC